MKEALVSPDLTVSIVDSLIPEPNKNEVLIKVAVAGSNPKDWKMPSYGNLTLNSGDDISGWVEKVGADVVEFKKGDRVAAMHVMRASGGAFAECAVAPASTTFHLPESISFEEAATIPLAALTAVVALYWNLKLPFPWEDAQTKQPLIIYGGSSAIGAFAIKLAVRSNIHPLVVVAGKSQDFVKSLIDESKGDAIVDYRGGREEVVKGIKAALVKANVGAPKHAFDCISEHGSFETLTDVLAPDGHITVVLLEGDYSAVREGQITSLTYVGDVHGQKPRREGNKGIRYIAQGRAEDLGLAFSRLFTRGLHDGWFTGHPYEVVPGGLNGLSSGLKNLKAGKANAVKYVYRVSDTS